MNVLQSVDMYLYTPRGDTGVLHCVSARVHDCLSLQEKCIYAGFLGIQAQRELRDERTIVLHSSLVASLFDIEISLRCF